MIKVRLFLCAEGAVFDQQTNNLSIFNIIEQAQGVAFPLLLSRLAVIATLARERTDGEPENGIVRVSLNDKEIHRWDCPLSFQNKLRTRTILRVGGLMIPSPGDLRFRLFFNGRSRAEYVIPITGSKQPTVTSRPEPGQGRARARAPSVQPKKKKRKPQKKRRRAKK